MTDLDKIFNNENIVLDYEKLIKRHKYIFNNKFEIPRLSRDNRIIYWNKMIIFINFIL